MEISNEYIYICSSCKQEFDGTKNEPSRICNHCGTIVINPYFNANISAIASEQCDDCKNTGLIILPMSYKNRYFRIAFRCNCRDYGMKMSKKIPSINDIQLDKFGSIDFEIRRSQLFKTLEEYMSSKTTAKLDFMEE